MSTVSHQRPPLGRADLVRVLVNSDSEQLELAMASIAETIVETWRPIEISEQTQVLFESDSQHVDVPENNLACELPAVPFLRVCQYESYDLSQSSDQEPSLADSTRSLSNPHVPTPPEFVPLFSKSELLSTLRKHSRLFRESREPDIGVAVDRLSRGIRLESVPYRRLAAWGTELQVIVDESKRLTPYRFDQEAALDWLGMVYPKQSLVIVRNLESLHRLPPSGTPVLVLGDLGCLSIHEAAELKPFWLDCGRQFRDNGNPAIALVPTFSARVSPELRDLWTVVSWGAAGASAPSTQERAKWLDWLKIMISPSLRLEPGLLRELRCLLPATRSDPGWEALIWQDSLLSSRHQVAATLEANQQEQLRARFGDLPIELQTKVRERLECWHRRDFSLLWAATVTSLPPASDGSDSDAIGNAEAILREFAEANQDRAIGYSTAMWQGEVVRRTANCEVPDSALRKSLMRACEAVLSKNNNGPVPRWFDLRLTKAIRDEEIKISVHHLGDQLVFSPVSSASNLEVGSPLGTLQTQGGKIKLSAVDTFWLSGRPPSWASDWGRDEYGAWANFSVNGVVQRMRWIQPGRFMMGSPDIEKDRLPDEGPIHPVSISSGYWMFDTPCTQELWLAVVGGKNPSFFEGLLRPVENVSREDAVRFQKKLGELKTDLVLRLPSEAEWEYACRAGTTSRRYGKLEDIAWNSRNSNRQTHPVALKKPNSWGLYDMLGNVWEQCVDGKRAYSKEDIVDPVGPSDIATIRVLRGGSWRSDARDARAAFRGLDRAWDKSNRIGFRCLSSGDEPSPVSETGGVAERDAEHAVRFGPEARKNILISVREPVSVEVPVKAKFQLESTRERLVYERVTKPAWAESMGRDWYGLWSEFRVGDVVQRLRWIPPGRFRMGSPESEEGRWDDEGPVHEVTITKGYWLFDTPCTQALWLAVLGGKNPSRFVDPLRPVEQVSWDDVQGFLDATNTKLPGLNLRLPTEAQWEYACRAGTSEATYAGDLVFLGQNNAPVLDDIAWYGGNSGHEYDLDEGEDSSSWKEKQYDHKKAGTSRVGLKDPNGWGLLDMLGNVWEWCDDGKRTYITEVRTDPETPVSGGAARVFRGGGWDGGARHARAAYRSAYVPSYRDGNLGFRCLNSG
jgi:formylglycine-generating enzyme required for sulfatase activity